jgi:NADP-dependent aldehyde dehydrogenase
VDAVLELLPSLPGSLTGGVHAADGELDDPYSLVDRVGRLIFNGWPTGVAVCWAMHHGGPWPASTAPSTTSAGATAIRRWLQPIAYQNFPDELLPRKLQRAYPMAVQRLTQPPGGH